MYVWCLNFKELKIDLVILIVGTLIGMSGKKLRIIISGDSAYVLTASIPK